VAFALRRLYTEYHCGVAAQHSAASLIDVATTSASVKTVALVGKKHQPDQSFLPTAPTCKRWQRASSGLSHRTQGAAVGLKRSGDMGCRSSVSDGDHAPTGGRRAD
jgi:hypothetical protein